MGSISDFNLVEHCVLTDIKTKTARVARGDTPARPAVNAPTNASFQITHTTLCVPVVALSTENDKRLLEQLRTGFKRIWFNDFRFKFNGCTIFNSFTINWSKDCLMSTIADTTFKITDSNLYLPIVTLSSKDNLKLVKLFKKGFKIPVYWNKYKTKRKTRNLDNKNLTRFPVDASFQGVRRFFVLPFKHYYYYSY